MFNRGDLAAAEKEMQEAVDLTTHLVEDVGQNDDWLIEYATALGNLGIVQLQQNRAAQAQINLGKAIAIKRRAIKLTDPKQIGWSEFAATLSWSADASFRQGDLAAAKALRGEEQDLYRRMLAANPDDLPTMSSFTVSRRKQAEELMLQGDTRGALTVAREADGHAGRSLAADPGDLSTVEDAAGTALVLAKAELQSGDLAQAQQAADRAVRLAQRLVADDPIMLKWNGVLLGQARLTSYATRARRSAGVACQAALAPVMIESTRLDALLAAHPGDPKLTLAAARGQMMRADSSALSGDLVTAEAGWSKAGKTLAGFYGTLDAIRDPNGRVLADQLRRRLAAPRTLAVSGTVCD
jgi:tetratricopeptide (TPR) repeat protein